MKSQQKKHPIFLVLLISILFISACSGIQIGFEPEQPIQENINEPAQPAEPVPADQENTPPPIEESVSEPTPPEASSDSGSEDAAQQDPKLIEVNGWLGYVVSDTAYGDHLVLMPEGTGEFGITGANTEIENEIIGLRDKPEPGKHANLWGYIQCDVDDYNHCQMVVERLRYGANMTQGDPVEGWQGTIRTSTFNGSQSYIFELAGSYPIWYSIHSNDEAILQQLSTLANSGTAVYTWGELMTGIPDVNGTRIQASKIEVIH